MLWLQGYADLSDQREDFYNRRMYRRIHVSVTYSRSLGCLEGLCCQPLFACCMSTLARSAAISVWVVDVVHSAGGRCCHYVLGVAGRRSRLTYHQQQAKVWVIVVSDIRQHLSRCVCICTAGLLQPAHLQCSWCLDRCHGANRDQWQSVSPSTHGRDALPCPADKGKGTNVGLT